jgi:hypothetical protein
VHDPITMQRQGGPGTFDHAIDGRG